MRPSTVSCRWYAPRSYSNSMCRQSSMPTSICGAGQLAGCLSVRYGSDVQAAGRPGCPLPTSTPQACALVGFVMRGLACSVEACARSNLPEHAHPFAHTHPQQSVPRDVACAVGPAQSGTTHSHLPTHSPAPSPHKTTRPALPHLLTLMGGPGCGTSCVLRTQKAWSLTTLPPRLRATVTRSR